MGMGMGGGGGGRVGFSLMRSLRRDQNVTAHKLPKGIVKRIMGFAKPYKLALALFLVLIIIDALVGAANPLVYRAIIDQGIEKHNGSLVIWLAVLVGGLAIFDAALGLWERWISSRVGEGLIFDMRNKVFIHIQRMPIAFFTRTQTGTASAWLSRSSPC
jgi:ATP-binding cassette subfamily B protein